MNKEQLVKAIAAETGQPQSVVTKILNATTETIVETVANGDKITLVGFGTFEPRDRKERQGKNPQTGEPLTIPATTIPAFSASKAFKEKVKSL
ncbi:DNA binding protein HU [Crocosphaera subtropica ATCC 51142]|uniref:DNA binding protein HU n=1 Tax=Crocosphaera subtropica (strain ATCC 51142 / BH68) TaxID=43989 RepID=B1X2Q4_CROS5|nr:HU family DNA-binding protein [Crocosphaera subtropica]ACB54415.1 DNA binding protein HU [Crocosphaera subtropica ATCC 51142]